MANSSPVVRLEVKALPNAPASGVAGWLGNALKVRIHAPPEHGKANAELCRLLSRLLGLPQRAVTLERGSSSRRKVVLIEGLEEEQLRLRLPGGPPGHEKTQPSGRPGVPPTGQPPAP
jgi:uncharacterized protein (TIGR00251 family)